MKLYFHCIIQINREDFHEHKRHSPCNVSRLISLTNLHCFVHIKDQNALLLAFTYCMLILGVSCCECPVLLVLSLCLLNHTWQSAAEVLSSNNQEKNPLLLFMQNVYSLLGNTLFISVASVQNMGGH